MKCREHTKYISKREKRHFQDIIISTIIIMVILIFVMVTVDSCAGELVQVVSL